MVNKGDGMFHLCLLKNYCFVIMKSNLFSKMTKIFPSVTLNNWKCKCLYLNRVKKHIVKEGWGWGVVIIEEPHQGVFKTYA